MTESTLTGAFFFGGVTIVIFILPIFLYASRYAEEEKQSRGTVNAGDIVGIVGEVMFLHITIIFIVALFFGFAEIAFREVPSFQPSGLLMDFYKIEDSGEVSDFIKKWMTSTASLSDANPLDVASSSSLFLGMALLGIMMTIIYIAIPLSIVVFTVKYALGGKEEMRDESGVTRIIGASYFFIGATFLYFTHAIFSSSLVWFALGSVASDFSFYKAGMLIWEKLLMGKI